MKDARDSTLKAYYNITPIRLVFVLTLSHKQFTVFIWNSAKAHYSYGWRGFYNREATNQLYSSKKKDFHYTTMECGMWKVNTFISIIYNCVFYFVRCTGRMLWFSVIAAVMMVMCLNCLCKIQSCHRKWNWPTSHHLWGYKEAGQIWKRQLITLKLLQKKLSYVLKWGRGAFLTDLWAK